MDDLFGSERIQFFLRNRSDIKAWAAIEPDVIAATSELLARSQPLIEEAFAALEPPRSSAVTTAGRGSESSCAARIGRRLLPSRWSGIGPLIRCRTHPRSESSGGTTGRYSYRAAISPRGDRRQERAAEAGLQGANVGSLAGRELRQIDIRLVARARCLDRQHRRAIDAGLAACRRPDRLRSCRRLACKRDCGRGSGP